MVALCVFAGFSAPRQAGAEGAIAELNDASFASAVSGAQIPVLVEFKAKWCPYCKKQQPYIEALARNRHNEIDVYQVDIDANPNIARDYDAHILPTLVIIYQGNVVGRSEGALYGSELTDWVGDVEADIRKHQQNTELPAASEL
jgi:thioredoxin 1